MDPLNDQIDHAARVTAPGKRVELHAIGGLRVRAGGADITDQMGARHRALLAYLVHEGRPIYSGELAAVLSRGMDEDAELAGLRQAIAWLKENVPQLEIDVSRDSIALSSHVWSDVRELDEAIDRGDVKAVSRLYVGDFLAGFSLGSGPFDEWSREQRRKLRDSWEGAIRVKALEGERGERWESAADWWRILGDRNPLAGDLTARAMRAYGRARQRGEAARVFEAYLERTAAAGGDPDRAVEAAARELSIPRPKRPMTTGSRDGSPAGGPVGGGEPLGSNAGGDRQGKGQRGAGGPAAGGISFGSPTSRVSTMPGLDDFDDQEENFTVLGRGPRTLRSHETTELFTESALIHGSKTIWARLTTPRAIRAYRDFIERVVELSILTAQTLAHWSVAFAQASWRVTCRAAGAARGWASRTRTRTGQGIARAGRGVARVNRGIGRGVGRVGDGIGRGVAQVGGGIERAGKATARGVGSATSAGGRAGRGLGAGLWWIGRMALRPFVLLPGLLWALLRLVGRGVAWIFRRGSSKSARPRRGRSERRMAGAIRPVTAVAGWVLRRRVILVGALAGLILIVFLPISGDLIPPGLLDFSQESPVTSDVITLPEETVPRPVALEESPANEPTREEATPEEGASEQGASGGSDSEETSSKGGLARLRLPDISLPTFTLPKPDIDAPSLPSIASGVPEVIRRPVQRLGDMFSGPLLDSGDRIVVTDLQDGGPEDEPGLGHLAALVLEAALSDSRHFSVVPRERALVSAGGRRTDLSLTRAEALRLAPDLRVAAIITGRLDAGEDGSLDSLRLAVVDIATGAKAEEFGVEIPAGDWSAALTEGMSRLSRRLGEAKGSALTPTAVSTSLPALGAYARARAHLFSGRYGSATAEAQEAVRHDSAFAAAHQLQARALALRGRRAAAGEALERAHRHRDRLTERETLRVVADRAAFAGRQADAIIGYDYLFQRYRDDVEALKSIAVLQRRVGARGGGTGNLEVAYSIEPLDWPPLSRIARYLGYAGPLPRLGKAGDSQTAAPSGE